MIRWLKFGVGIPLVVAAILAAPASAQAAGAPVVSKDGNYCAVYVDTGKMACVQLEKDFPAAKAAAIGTTDTARLAGSYAYGVFFDNADYNTDAGSITFFGSADCTSSRTNVDGGWADTTSWKARISSYRGLSNCYIKIWYLTSYSGSTSGSYVYQDNWLDGLNDHVWSARFS